MTFKLLFFAVSSFQKTLKIIPERTKKQAQEQRRKETISFMNGVMDEITHLGNYSQPIDTSLITFVVAKNDAYFPRSSLMSMESVWPGCEVSCKLATVWNSQLTS